MPDTKTGMIIRNEVRRPERWPEHIQAEKRNEDLLAERCENRARVAENNEPQIGDYVILPDGREERITIIWWDGDVQLGDGSFFLNPSGTANLSFGAPKPSVKADRLTPYGDRTGTFWFFDGDYPRAHSAVHVTAPCKMFQLDRNPNEGSK